MLPVMAVRTAAEAGFFSRIVWVFPSSSSVEQLQLDVFVTQMLGSFSMTEDEAANLTLEDGSLRGMIAGVPFQAVHPEALPSLDQPVVVHFDLTYMKPGYKGEIKTPLYPQLLDTLDGLKSTGWKTTTVTISFSNLEGEIPLPSRFVARDLAAVFANPALLAEEPPRQWQLRTNALYIENFFKKEEVRKLYEEMTAADPSDASVKYALYNVARQFKEGDAALDYLQQAVELDPVYALEYLTLAETALKGKRPDKAIDMLQNARAKLPNNSFILLSLVRLAIDSHRQDLALQLLPLLQGETWSTIYHPDITEEIWNLDKRAREAQQAPVHEK